MIRIEKALLAARLVLVLMEGDGVLRKDDDIGAELLTAWLGPRVAGLSTKRVVAALVATKSSIFGGDQEGAQLFASWLGPRVTHETETLCGRWLANPKDVLCNDRETARKSLMEAVEQYPVDLDKMRTCRVSYEINLRSLKKHKRRDARDVSLEEMKLLRAELRDAIKVYQMSCVKEAVTPTSRRQELDRINTQAQRLLNVPKAVFGLDALPQPFETRPTIRAPNCF